MISFVQGNILASNDDALVNPINCTPAMGKGLALQFRNAIPGLYQAHQTAAKAGMLAPGKLHLFYSPSNRKPLLDFQPSVIGGICRGLKTLNPGSERFWNLPTPLRPSNQSQSPRLAVGLVVFAGILCDHSSKAS